MTSSRDMSSNEHKTNPMKMHIYKSQEVTLPDMWILTLINAQDLSAAFGFGARNWLHEIKAYKIYHLLL